MGNSAEHTVCHAGNAGDALVFSESYENQTAAPYMAVDSSVVRVLYSCGNTGRKCSGSGYADASKDGLLSGYNICFL